MKADDSDGEGFGNWIVAAAACGHSMRLIQDLIFFSRCIVIIQENVALGALRPANFDFDPAFAWYFLVV